MDMNVDKEWLLKMADAEDECRSVSCGAMERKQTWREWMRMKLFPAKHCFKPETKFDPKDCVVVHSITSLSLVDRLRCLITGVVVVTTRTSTEFEVGQAVSVSTCHIGAWKDLS